MKKLPFVLFGGLCIFIMFACTPDPCEDVSCVHGSCIEGTCDCDRGYEGINCDEEKELKELWITNIRINSFPAYRDGELWDSSSAPDVYPVIMDDIAIEIYRSETYYQDASNTETYDFSCTVNIPSFVEMHHVVVYDHDSLDSDDILGGVGANIWEHAKGKAFPSVITLAYQDFSFELTLSYIFN